MRISFLTLVLLATVGTPYPASAITITFDTMNGAITFSILGSNWSGGTVRTEGNPSLYASGAFSYEVDPGGAEVTFDQPVTNVRFFYVHGAGHGAGVATSFDASDSMLDTRNSVPNTGSGSKFVDFPTSPGISKITFSDGVIDSFSYDPVPSNEPPVAVITSIDCTGLVCDFDGSGSSDSDGTITDFSWDFGDGTMLNGSSLVMVQHTFATAGAFTVTLTVTDDQNDIDMATANVSVSTPFVIDASVEGSWLDPNVSGQGMLMDYFPGVNKLFVAWFTFDPAGGAKLANSSVRWVTAVLDITGDTASGDVFATTDGAFNAPMPAPVNSVVGTMSIQFSGCDAATVDFSLDPPDNVMGTISIVPLGTVVDTNFSCGGM